LFDPDPQILQNELAWQWHGWGNQPSMDHGPSPPYIMHLMILRLPWILLFHLVLDIYGKYTGQFITKTTALCKFEIPLVMKTFSLHGFINQFMKATDAFLLLTKDK
jgi:hypothetical protein